MVPGPSDKQVLKSTYRPSSIGLRKSRSVRIHSKMYPSSRVDTEDASQEWTLSTSELKMNR